MNIQKVIRQFEFDLQGSIEFINRYDQRLRKIAEKIDRQGVAGSGSDLNSLHRLKMTLERERDRAWACRRELDTRLATARALATQDARVPRVLDLSGR